MKRARKVALVVAFIVMSVAVLSMTLSKFFERDATDTASFEAPSAAPEIVTEGERLTEIANRSAESTRAILRAKQVETDDVSDRLWSDFRKTFPFHIQEVALSKPHPDGSRTVILSEPPPDVSIDDILAAAESTIVSYRIREHPVGNDGWVRDVVLRLRGDDETLANVASALLRTIYRTSYKSYVLPLPARRSAGGANLDLDVTTTEIQAWLSDETFVPVVAGAAMTAEQVFASAHSAVYLTSKPGLVAWWMPKGVMVDDLAVEARQFALDSDIIIGAVRRDAGVLIVARERQVAVQDLPPLRFETMRLLAAAPNTQEDQLGQSYQRRAKFAGIMGDGRDWAPIYLSPELVDTEYGSLLNITDQMLKGWSEGGSVGYIRFEEYPQPSHYRFNSVLEELGGSFVTFNWNTTGVGYVIPGDGSDFFALNRTGALPVSYIPDGMEDDAAEKVIETERAGYDYFATLNEPNLVRVVQYAALYQIFSAFDIHGRTDNLKRNEFPEEELTRLTEEMANKLGSMDEDALEKVIDRIANHYSADHDTVREKVRGILFENIVTGSKLESAEDNALHSDVLSAFACVSKMPERYTRAVAERSDAWIHTPVVVISWYDSVDGAVLTGGHNLRARTTKVTVTESVPEGMPQYTPEGELRIHPRDARRAPELVYVGAKTADRQPSAVAARLRDALRRPALRAEPRRRVEALRLASDLSSDSAPLAQRGAATTTARGWRATASDALVETATEHGVYIERLADRSIRIVCEEGRREIQAATIEDATDAVVQILKRGGAGEDAFAHVELRGFQNNEAGGFLRATNNRLRESNRDISALVTDGRIDPAMAREIRARRYDFSRATVRETPVQMIGGRPQATIVVEVPRSDAAGMARTEVKVAMHPEMKPGLFTRLMTEIRMRIQKIITELGTQFDAFTFNLRVNREIKALSRETGVPIDIVEQQFIDAGTDIYFALLEWLGEERPAA